MIGLVGADFPGNPVNFYGDVTDQDDQSPPENVDIVAVDPGLDEELNSKEADADGSLGGPGLADGKLSVGDDQPDVGVTFHLHSPDGPQVTDINPVNDDIDVINHDDHGPVVDLDSRDGHNVEVELTFDSFEAEAELTDITAELVADTITDQDTTQLNEVTAEYDDGSEEDVTDAVELQSGNEDIATIDGSTIVGESPGTVEIDVEYTEDDVTETDTVELTVERSLTDLELGLDDTTLEEGETTDATVTAAYSDGSEEDVTDAVELQSGNEDIATIDASTIVGESPGTVEIDVEYTEDDVTETDTVELTVERSLTDLELGLDDTTLEEGETTDATVTAAYSDGSEEDVTDETTITSEPSDGVTISGSTITADSSGEHQIRAFYPDDTDFEGVDVVILEVDADEDDGGNGGGSDPGEEVEDVEIALDETTLLEGDTTDATVTVEYDDGSEEDVTDEADIESFETDVATVDDTTITAEAAGSAPIYVSYEGEASLQTLTVDPTLTDVVLDLDDTTLTENDTTSATVTAAYSDGSEEDVTGAVELQSGNEDIATIDGSTIVGESPGTVEIDVEYTEDDVTETDTVELTVERSLTDLELGLDDTTLEEGETTDATVTAAYSDGSEEDVTDAVELQSGNEDIATIDGSTIVGESPGTVEIDVEYTEDDVTETDTVELTVERSLTDLELGLDDTTLEEGETTDATVTAEYSDGSEEDVTDDVTIDSEDETIATVDGSTISAESDGNVTLSATYSENDDTETDEQSLTVEAEEEGDDDDGIPGFGIGSALLAISAAGYLLRRRLASNGDMSATND